MKKSSVLLCLIVLGLATQCLVATPTAPPRPTPDGGSTMLMLSAGVGGLACLLKRIRR